ncbi:hypothetical protein ACMDCT_04275 [Halomonadaceae bacterium KBTZ08]
MTPRPAPTSLALFLLAGASLCQAGDPRELNLVASKGDLGLGGIKEWDLRLRMDAVAEPAEAPESILVNAHSSDELNLDHFLLSGQTDTISVQLGHHQAAREGLLFDGETDWGLSASSKLDPLNSRVSVFAVNTGGLSSTERALQDAGRTPYYTGGIWESTLPIGVTDATLWAGYINGDQDSLQYRHGYSVGMSSNWLDERLGLELEQATSLLSANSERPGLGASDTAYNASLLYRPRAQLPFLQWEIGAEARYAGSGFHSPGNPSVNQGYSSERIYLDLEPFEVGSLGYSYRELKRLHGQNRLNSHGNRIVADLTVSPWGWLSLQPYGEFEYRQYEDLDVTGYQSLFRLTADTWLIPDELAYRNTFKVSRTYGPDDSLRIRDENRQSISGELQWQALTPTQNRTGLDINLSFSADRHRSHLDSNAGLDDYQVLLSISSGND